MTEENRHYRDRKALYENPKIHGRFVHFLSKLYKIASSYNLPESRVAPGYSTCTLADTENNQVFTAKWRLDAEPDTSVTDKHALYQLSHRDHKALVDLYDYMLFAYDAKHCRNQAINSALKQTYRFLKFINEHNGSIDRWSSYNKVVNNESL